MISVILMLILLIVLVVVGLPLAFSIAGSSVFYYALTDQIKLMLTVPGRLFTGTFTFMMIALPMFILVGQLMNTCGLTKRLIDFSEYLVRPIRGGLGEVNIVASMIFGGISGSSVADTAGIGSILIPSMEEKGYPSDFAAGITVASSTMGMIIPPSIPVIMYAMISNESIGKLFAAGVIPGLMIGVFQIIVCQIISRKRGYISKKKQPIDKAKFKKAMIEGIPVSLLPLFIILATTTGICTASESACIAVVYALILGKFVYKQLKWKQIIEALKNTFIMSSTIMIVVCFTYLFSYILTVENIPQILADAFLSLNLSHTAMLFIFMIFLVAVGMFVDVTPTILLVVPIMLPVMQNFGIDTLQFGTMMLVSTALGLATPPIGMCLNTCSKINGMSIIDIFKGAAPFLVCNVVVLALCTFAPWVSHWIPSLM